MIHPDALIVDLEPEGFAKLCEVASHRLYAVPVEIQLLHRSGEVLNVLDTKEGVLDRFREPFQDPSARAQEVLEESGAERVILIDCDAIEDLCGAQVELARTVQTQTELLWRANELFFKHPAVAVAPLPELSPWPALSAAARNLDDYWAVLGTWEGDALFLSLIARVESGLVTHLTSADHFGVRPMRTDATKLIEAVEQRGPVDVALLCDFSQFERALTEEDPLRGLKALAEGEVIFQRGLDELFGAPAG
jgi:hypothetical protein